MSEYGIDRIEIMPLKFRIQQFMLDHHLDFVDPDVASYLYQSVLIYLRSVIHRMSNHKKKYDIECPLLKPTPTKEKDKEQDDKDANQIQTVIIQEISPFTVKNLYECYKAFPYIIPKQDVFQVHLEKVLSVLRVSQQRDKK